MKRRGISKLVREPHWYKDAVIYELHVRAFCDSNGDGIGDFAGLASKMDYLEELGATALWLLPFYPSPLKDDGYDISDYMNVNPAYGSLADFKKVLKEAHRRGIRVITELVINHTSSEHPWFQRARHAPPGSRHRNFYVWSDTPERYSGARIIFQDFETSNWSWDPVAKAYYWHRFYSHQPDLNFENPEMQKALLKVLDFWMSMGVDGMRLDAVPYLFERDGTNCENLSETHAYLKTLRSYVDEKYEDRVLLAEANQWPEDAAAYFGSGDECHMNFHFPLMPRMFMALHLEDRFPIADILDQTPEIPDACQWALFLRNHDELTLEMVTDEDRDYMWRVYAEDSQARINLGIRRRLAPLVRTRPKIELLNALLFSLPGTPVIYYGDELGMGDNIYLGDRDGVRTPMQWSPDRNAGFSRANPQRLYLPIIVDPEYHYEAINVDTELSNPSSLLWWIKRLISLRTRHKVFGRGTLEVLHPENKKVLAFVRAYEGERILVIANLSRHPQHVNLDLAEFAGLVPEELFGRVPFPAITQSPYALSLSPYGFFWFELVEPSASARGSSDLPSLEGVTRLSDILQGALRGRIESYLSGYLQQQRWFRSKARRVRTIQIDDELSLSETALLLFVRVEYYEGPEEIYLVPLALCEGEAADHILRDSSTSVLARVERGPESGSVVICEASIMEGFGQLLLKTLIQRKSTKTKQGKLLSTSRLKLQEEIGRPRIGPAEQTNTSIIYGESLFLKLLRVVEEGVNPDVELLHYLNERTSFSHVPESVGSLEYQSRSKKKATVAALQVYVPNQGDVWKVMLETLDRFSERALAQSSAKHPPLPEGSWMERRNEEPPEPVREALGHVIPLMRLLGQRTAEMHAALAQDVRDTQFAPEPFTELYQRSLYQSSRTRWVAAMDTLRHKVRDLSEEDQHQAQELLQKRRVVEKHLKTIMQRSVRAQRTRVHGDFHLGQVLFTGKDFVIIDFEGEPAKPLSERRFKRSPLTDVAGMIRSFHYAAATTLRQHDEAEREWEGLRLWFKVWAEWVSTIYFNAYLEVSSESTAPSDCPILPASPEDLEQMLQFYLLDKCIYELKYELNNRIDWVSIPLRALGELLAERE